MTALPDETWDCQVYVALQKAFGDDVPTRIKAVTQKLLESGGEDGVAPRGCRGKSFSPTPPRPLSPSNPFGGGRAVGSVETPAVFKRLAKDTQARRERDRRNEEALRRHATTKKPSTRTKLKVAGSEGVVGATLSDPAQPDVAARGAQPESAYERLYKEAKKISERRQRTMQAALQQEEEQIRSEALRALGRDSDRTCGRDGASTTLVPKEATLAPRIRSWSPVRSDPVRAGASKYGYTRPLGSGSASSAVALERAARQRAPPPPGAMRCLRQDANRQWIEDPRQPTRIFSALVEGSDNSEATKSVQHDGNCHSGASQPPSSIKLVEVAEAHAETDAKPDTSAEQDVMVLERQLGVLLAGADYLRRLVESAEVRVAGGASLSSSTTTMCGADMALAPQESRVVHWRAANCEAVETWGDGASKDWTPATPLSALAAARLVNSTAASSPPKVVTRVWRVDLERRDTEQRVGIDVDELTNGAILVKSVTKGEVVDAWNVANPDWAISPGDFIIAVNGARRDLITMCRSEQNLQFEVVREIPAARQ